MFPEERFEVRPDKSRIDVLGNHQLARFRLGEILESESWRGRMEWCRGVERGMGDVDKFMLRWVGSDEGSIGPEE